MMWGEGRIPDSLAFIYFCESGPHEKPQPCGGQQVMTVVQQKDYEEFLKSRQWFMRVI